MATIPFPDKVGDSTFHTHPTVSNVTYKVTKANEFYHTVQTIRTSDTSVLAFRKALWKKWRSYMRLFPLLLKFTKTAILPLGKRKIFLYFLANIFANLIPAWQTAAKYRLKEAMRSTLYSRTVNKGSMLKALVVEAACFIVGKAVESPIDRVRTQLQARYQRSIQRSVLAARSKLDSVTMEDAKVTKLVTDINELAGGDWSNHLLLDRVVEIVNTFVRVLSQGGMAYRLATSSRSNTRVAIVSLIASILETIRAHYDDADDMIQFACTNEDANALLKYERLAMATGRQEQLLGLNDYYAKQYARLSEKLGDAVVSKPDVYARSTVSASLWRLSERILDFVLWGTFALHLTGSADQVDVAKAISDFELLQTTLNDTISEALAFRRRLGRLPRSTRSIQAFYQLPKIASRLAFSEAVVTVAKPQSTAHEPDSSVPYIEFKNVTFTYPGSTTPSISNLSFKIKAGSLVSIVGDSGSGKSTVIALAVRLVDPDEGEILIDGTPIRQHNLDDLYSNLSFLPQFTTRPMEATIREFLSWGKLDATEADFKEAAEETGMWEWIQKQPQGLDTLFHKISHYSNNITPALLLERSQLYDSYAYDSDAEDDEEDEGNKPVQSANETNEVQDADSVEDLRLVLRTLDASLVEPLVLEDLTVQAAQIALPAPSANECEELGGKKKLSLTLSNHCAGLSGGEWARLCLCRALLRKHVDLMILDENTASLDAKTSRDIWAKVLAKRGSKTILAVTHQFHIAHRSDDILFMRNGKLIEQGKHTELMSIEDGAYREQYESAFSSSGKNIATQTGDDNEEDALPALLSGSASVAPTPLLPSMQHSSSASTRETSEAPSETDGEVEYLDLNDVYPSVDEVEQMHVHEIVLHNSPLQALSPACAAGTNVSI